MAFQNIDVKQIKCFGWAYPIKDSWWGIVNSNLGWKANYLDKVNEDLAKNVEDCHESLFTAVFVDLDSSIEYKVFFDNAKKYWNIKLNNSKTAEVLPEEKKELQKSEMFKKTCKRATEILVRALDIFEERVKPVLEKARLLKVNEKKMLDIEMYLQDQGLMKNFKLAKFLK